MRPAGCSVVALLAVLVLAACGSGSDEGASSTRSTSPASSSAAPTTTPSNVPSTPPAAPATTPPSAPETPDRTATAPPPGAPAAEPARWRPAARTTWQYQLSGTLDLTVPADVYDVDWQETSAAQVRQLHDAGRRVVCYLNAGAYEEWRPDAGDYPAAVLGAPLDGWPGERWLDIRRTDVLLPIIAARMDVCRDKGFDAVEPDNVDGYANDSGFPLGAQDQLDFNRAVARLAHERGLAVGLKNDVEQAAALEPSFDFAVNEECLAYDECDAYAPFVRAGKAVLHVEYEQPTPEQCARASAIGVNSIVKELDLGPGLRSC
ncbi:hypothetical protein SAMN05660485_02927 [Blastococcus fimeti]|nr:hypothetical protein SAMN05660485_02927 [Blastococcus fimeti]